MTKKSIIIIYLIALFFSCKRNDKNSKQIIVDRLERQMQVSNTIHCNKLNEETKKIYPRSTNEFGKVIYVRSSDWISGFYPGCLWKMYELTHNNVWKNSASLYTEKLTNEQFNNSNHDIGFKIMCSFGNGFKATNDPSYRNILIQAAKTLISRFDKNVGCIRSWDHHRDKWQYPVIIDNLMNLELLFEASRLSGDPVYYNVALSHANNTLQNHMRPDGSCFHVVDYNPANGEILSKGTYQGYSDSSSWARGQAWAIYGFTMIYRETREIKFLAQAEKTASYILNHPTLANDPIPYWDLEAPDLAQQPKDASAAAIIASALYELSGYSEKNKSLYLKKADSMINALCSDTYLKTTNSGFLLDHSTGHKPKNHEIDKPLIYADYYLLEALSRKPNN